MSSSSYSREGEEGSEKFVDQPCTRHTCWYLENWRQTASKTCFGGGFCQCSLQMAGREQSEQWWGPVWGSCGGQRDQALFGSEFLLVPRNRHANLLGSTLRAALHKTRGEGRHPTIHSKAAACVRILLSKLHARATLTSFSKRTVTYPRIHKKQMSTGRKQARSLASPSTACSISDCVITWPAPHGSGLPSLDRVIAYTALFSNCFP